MMSIGSIVYSTHRPILARPGAFRETKTPRENGASLADKSFRLVRLHPVPGVVELRARATRLRSGDRAEHDGGRHVNCVVVLVDPGEAHQRKAGLRVLHHLGLVS